MYFEHNPQTTWIMVLSYAPAPLSPRPHRSHRGSNKMRLATSIARPLRCHAAANFFCCCLIVCCSDSECRWPTKWLAAAYFSSISLGSHSQTMSESHLSPVDLSTMNDQHMTDVSSGVEPLRRSSSTRRLMLLVRAA